MMFSQDVMRTNGRQIASIIRVDMMMRDGSINITIRAFAPASQVGTDANVMIGGFRGALVGTMRGTVDVATGQVDGIILMALTDDVVRVVNEGVFHMLSVHKAAQDKAKAEAKAKADAKSGK